MSLERYGDYQLIKRLATGGMAQIYLARQVGLEGFEKLLVVKRILPHLTENDDFVRMFLDEARIAARLNHPNIVQIFNLGAQDDSYFIAMEYIHGEDVRRVWRRAESVGRRFPVALVCRVIMDACAGLDYAHKKADPAGKPLNIVHRDISPQNILVTFEGGVKIVDFGIAKAADQATVTRSGVLKGKYAYMSPEQASGQRKLDHRTDIFALGIVLYELLTGTRLFKRANDIQTLNAVTECDVSPPSTVSDRVPADLDPVVMRALAKNPDERYQEAIHLQVALERWLLLHKLPSSSAHLAAFMGEVYADRLAREAEEGRFLVEELDGSKGKEEEAPPQASPAKATPKTPPPKSSPMGESALPDPDATKAARPQRALERAAHAYAKRRSKTDSSIQATEISLTKKEHGSRWLPWVFGLAMLGIGVFGFLLWRQIVGPAVSAVAQSRSPVSDAGSPSRLDSGEAASAAVHLTVQTDPVGAQVLIDGVARGRSPLRLDAAPHREVVVGAELAGYRDLERRVLVGDGPMEIVLTLEKKKESSKPMGTVRFVVTPWAEVLCGSIPLGQTPFRERHLPAGEYECRFTHPELGTMTQKVVVRANQTQVVKVKFEGAW
ncbi:MAG: serine/threonine protein kinase [Myxococcota bacterium]